MLDDEKVKCTLKFYDQFCKSSSSIRETTT